MKTILYNPIFINPQAYYVFPRLTRYLQPDNESTSEPANYIGTIEVKVIAYGDTTLKRTYTNTDSIDLSEFKNTWIRISLFTKVGSCVLGEWKIGNMESDLPYIDPEVLASLKAVVIVGNKTNNDSDRAIVKNLVDASNPFVISNAAFKLNSGFGKYETELSNTRIWTQSKETTSSPFSSNYNGLSGWIVFANTELTNSADMPSFKIQVKGLLEGQELIYRYYDSTGQTNVYSMTKDGKYTLPADVRTAKPLTSNTSGFQIVKNETNTITITQIPSFVGAFVTDGIDDLITSTKTVQEMLGGSNEITVVSLITHISGTGKYNIIGDGGIQVSDYSGQTFMAGTSSSGEKIVELGDKEKLQAVQYTTFDSKLTIGLEDSSYAYYGTFVFNKENVPVDWIHQVIAYFNLDRTLNPDILCNTIKQGITNENHAEFGDKLIDFSGNGRDIQLNNIAWKGDSGIGKYETDFTTWTRGHFTDEVNFTPSKIEVTGILTTNSILINNKPTPIYNVEIHSPNKSIVVYYQYNDDTGVKRIALVDGINELPSVNDSLFVTSDRLNSKGITITQIPSHAGALCLDGVNDFGKVTGMPVYKDYTVVTDREIFANIGAILSKNNPGAFVETAGNSVYSFGQATSGLKFISTRSISYLSKYSYCGQSIAAGAAEDVPDMWLGTIRDGDSRFFNGAIYSLMSFPYSMSEFLIERQLKKHKLGTLYPDMVEFRPVIKSNVLLDAKPTFVIRGTSTYLNAGDYVPENSQIWVSIKMNNIADRITKFTVNGKTIDIPENAYSEVTLQYGFPFVIDKSPQKISITIEQDENYVLFNPVINSNYDNYKLTFHLREYEKLINIGDYIPKGTYIRANLYLKNDIDELVTFTFNGVNIDYAKSPVLDTAYNIRQIYNYDSPQEVNITIDEYIRYEDIVQPYPVLLRFNDENGNEVSWGDKIKVGSSITRIGSAADSNLLPNIYNIFGLLLNGNQVTSFKVIVEKTMVFKAKSTYIFDNNEPNCILSPRLLRIPNSSYKILGYIPDISGHGNHGKINNSAYASMSGANGYPYDYRNSSFWCDSVLTKVVSGELIEYFAVKNSTGFSNITSGVYKGEIKVTGVTKAISENKISRLRIYTNSTTDNELIDITQDGNYNIDIKGVGDANRVFFYAIPNNPNESIAVRLTEPIYIEQVGEYEGAYCLDGVDDFVTIPTTVGGKQVLMKVNWDSPNASILYDQRGYNNEFAIYNGTNDSDGNPIPAYQGRNNGQTYIDGILNSNIKASELRAITHNITITNELSSGANKTYPIIGSNKSNAFFVNMALYDFMLFDNISTDDKIKELNEYVGIEAKVELPPYYWDAYGKTNLDGDKATIQQRGVAVGDYDLTNNNLAYEGMSGYNGYPVVFGTNKTYANLVPNDGNFILTSSHNIINVTKFDTSYGLLYSHIKLDGKLTSRNIDYPSYKIKVTGLGENFGLHYSYLESSSDTTVKGFEINNDGIYIIPKSFASDGSLTSNSDWIGFIFTGTAPESCNVTIEVLPEYENGLVYDGITDYSKNANIPALDDFTAIIKREWLKNRVVL